MSRCGSGHEVPEGQKFCGECGSAVASKDTPTDDPPEGVLRIEQAASRTARWVHDEPEQGAMLVVGALIAFVALIAIMVLIAVNLAGGDSNDTAGGSRGDVPSESDDVTTTTSLDSVLALAPSERSEDQNEAVALYGVRVGSTSAGRYTDEEILRILRRICAELESGQSFPAELWVAWAIRDHEPADLVLAVFWEAPILCPEQTAVLHDYVLQRTGG